MQETDIVKISDDVHSLKESFAGMNQRVDGMDKALISMAESQKRIVDIVGDLREQKQININFTHRLDKTDAEIALIKQKQDSQTASIFANKDRIANLGYKVSMIIGMIYLLFPQIKGLFGS